MVAGVPGAPSTSPVATIAATGMPFPSPLARHMMSGRVAGVLDGEEAAGAGEAGLHLVGDEQDPVAVAEPAEAGEEVPGGTT